MYTDRGPCCAALAGAGGGRSSGWVEVGCWVKSVQPGYLGLFDHHKVVPFNLLPQGGVWRVRCATAARTLKASPCRSIAPR